MKDTYEFRSEQLNFDLKVEPFDCIDYVHASEICELILNNPKDSVKREWIQAFTSFQNLKVSYSSASGNKIFINLTKEVLNDFFTKNSFSTSFIFNSVFEYVVAVWNKYTPSENDSVEKKSQIQSHPLLP
jgi:hypothetical protein